MGKNKKLDLLTLILFGVLAVSVIMVIVGVCINWTAITTTLMGKDSVDAQTLADLAETNSKAKDGLDGYGAMAAFAYITLVLVILTAIAYVVSKFVDVKVLKWVVLGLAALTVVSAIVAIATTYGFCGNYTNTEGGALASAKTAPAAGAWLAAIFGIVGGAGGIVGALKK